MSYQRYRKTLKRQYSSTNPIYLLAVLFIAYLACVFLAAFIAVV